MNDYINKALRLFTDYVSTHSVAVVLRDRQGNATTGTSICIEVGSRFLLATAGHVIEDMKDDQIQLIPAGELSARPLPFAGRSCSPERPAPTTDVAWIELDRRSAVDHRLRFLKLSDLKLYQNFDRNRPFLVHGYPHEAAALSKAHADMESTVGYTMMAVPDNLPRELRDYELALEYPPRDAQGKPIASAPAAFGFSGGGVWRDLRAEESLIMSPERLQLVGINTCWDKASATLFATRIECWLDLVRQDFPETRDEVDRLLLIGYAESGLDSGNLDLAIEKYSELVSADLSDSLTINRLGDLLVQAQRLDEAVELFVRLASDCAKSGFFVKAISLYKKAIKLDPTRLQIYEALAELYFRQGLREEAVQQYKILEDYYTKHGLRDHADRMRQGISKVGTASIVHPTTTTHHPTKGLPIVGVPLVRSLSDLVVFLCHASEDKVRVRQLYSRLKEDLFQPWLDEEDLLPGQRWELEIRKALRRSHVVIICLSHRAVTKAGFLHKEIRVALDVLDEQPEGVIFVIPARLEDCPIPDSLSSLHYVDLFSASGYEKLLRAIHARATQLGFTTATGA